MSTLLLNPCRLSLPLATQLAEMSQAWLFLCGYSLQYHASLSAVLAGSSPRPDLMLAALDVLEALKSTPDGRQALADLLGEPVFEHAKGE